MSIQNVKYGFCLDEFNNIVSIKDITEGNRYAHRYKCIECGQEMIPKIGKIKIHHFAHAADVDCNGESYLHKLAKRRIREKFLSSENFSIIFNRPAPCCEKEHCIYAVPEGHYGSSCSFDVDIPMDLKIWNGRTLYDKCEEEVTIGKFRADLLLSNSNNPKLPPVFIEVKVTHESTEEKLASDYRIIETWTISSEKDIENIVSNGFVEGKNCNTYNFNPPPPNLLEPIGYQPILRFVLRTNGSARVYYNYEKIRCDKILQKLEKDSLAEINLTSGGFYINRETIASSVVLDSYQIGLLYFVKKGYDIKNCRLCKFRYYNSSYNKHICILYKKNGLAKPDVGQMKALDCPNYTLNPGWDNITLEQLQQNIMEVPDNNTQVKMR